MILTISEDFTSSVSLDSELTSLPEGGMYLNSGVHASITVDNLLSLLPNLSITPAVYAAGTTYGKFTSTRKLNDIVTYNSVIYQSIATANVGNTPDSSPNEWLATNLDSLRIKSFYLRSQDNALRLINLTRRLVDSQYLYSIAEVSETPSSVILPNDYAGWVFEPKGSDYVRIRINQVAFQATTATPQNLYVVNQGQLITTIPLTTNTEGRLVFEDIDYTFYGKGKWYFVVDSQEVLTNGSAIDPLKWDGFVAYTCSGIGASPQAADYSYGVSNNGLNFNISAYFDSQIYVDNNLRDFANYLQSAWELDVLNMYLSNSHNRSNSTERRQVDRELLIAETKEKNAYSVAEKFDKEKRAAKALLAKTLDREINNQDEFEIEITSI
jgi:hypothetical protein